MISVATMAQDALVQDWHLMRCRVRRWQRMREEDSENSVVLNIRVEYDTSRDESNSRHTTVDDRFGDTVG